MNMSPHINELITALAKAQGKIQPAIKDKYNPHYKSHYADLESIWAACRLPLSEQGLAVIQTIETNEKDLVLVTTLAHSSGQWMRSDMPIITQKMDPQGIGSALSYYRRYSLASIAGIVTEDDDAESNYAPSPKNSSVNKMPKGTEKNEVKIEVAKITKEQACELNEKLLWCPIEYQRDMNDFCKKISVAENFEGLPVSRLERVTQSINQKLAECKSALQPDEQAVEA
jgi:hypothetical protein